MEEIDLILNSASIVTIVINDIAYNLHSYVFDTYFKKQDITAYTIDCEQSIVVSLIGLLYTDTCDDRLDTPAIYKFVNDHMNMPVNKLAKMFSVVRRNMEIKQLVDDFESGQLLNDVSFNKIKVIINYGLSLHDDPLVNGFNINKITSQFLLRILELRGVMLLQCAKMVYTDGWEMMA